MKPRVAAKHITDGTALTSVGEPFPAKLAGRCVICSGRVEQGKPIVRVEAVGGTNGYAHADCPGTTAADRRAAKASALLGLNAAPIRQSPAPDANDTSEDEPTPLAATAGPAPADAPVDALLLDWPYELVERVESDAPLDRELDEQDLLALARSFLVAGDFYMAEWASHVASQRDQASAPEWDAILGYVRSFACEDVDAAQDSRIAALPPAAQSSERARIDAIRNERRACDQVVLNEAVSFHHAQARAIDERAAKNYALAAAFSRHANALERVDLEQQLREQAAGVLDRLDLSVPPPYPSSVPALRLVMNTDDPAELRSWSRGAREDGRRREAAWCALRSLHLEWHPNAILQVAAWLRHSSDSANAFRLAAQAAHDDPQNLAALIVQIAALTDLGDLAGAIGVAEAPGMRRRMFGHPFAWNAVGRTYALAGRFDDADRSFKSAWAAANERKDRSGELARASYLRRLLLAGGLDELRADRS